MFFDKISDLDTVIDIPLLDSFKVEGEYLKKARAKLIEEDKINKKLLVNNPNRKDLSLRYNHVLLKRV